MLSTIVQALPSHASRRASMVIALLITVGIALRIWGATIQVEPFSDFQRYFAVATEFSETGSLSYRGEPFIFQPPAYPAVLGAVFKVFGASVTVGVLLNLALSVASLLILWKTLVRLNVAPWLSAGALAIFAIYPGFIAFVPILGSETLSVFLVCLVMFVSTYPGTKAAALLGLLLAVLALARPQYLPIAAVIVVIALLRGQFHAALATALAFAVVLGPWVVRNQVVFGMPVAVSANGGYVAFVNNNNSNTTATWMALSQIALTPEQRQRFEAAGGGAMFQKGDESEKTFLWTPKVDKVANQEAMDWILEHPQQFLRLALTRLTNTFQNAGDSILVWLHPNDPPKNRTIGTLTTVLTLLVTIVAAVATLLLLPRLKNPTVAVVLSVLALTLAGIAVFEGQGRYLVPMVPAMLTSIAMAATRPTGKLAD